MTKQVSMIDLTQEPERLIEVITQAFRMGWQRKRFYRRRPTGKLILSMYCYNWYNVNERHVSYAYTAGTFMRKMSEKQR